MNGRQYTPKLVASHVCFGTALPPTSPRGTTHRASQLRTPKLHPELDDRRPAASLGGTSLLLSLWRELDVSTTSNQRVQVVRRREVYYESDHVLPLVLNLFDGGHCIDDQAALQPDRAAIRKPVPD